MGQADDFSDATKRFLDLWQDQVGSFLRDPEVVSSWIETLQKMQEACFSAAQQATGGGDDHARKNAPRAETAAGRNHDAPTRAGLDFLLEFGERLRACEERIATLEAELAAAGGAGGKKPPKHSG